MRVGFDTQARLLETVVLVWDGKWQTNQQLMSTAPDGGKLTWTAAVCLVCDNMNVWHG